MRFALLVLLAACSAGSIRITPVDKAPLGVGLTQSYKVYQELCTQDWLNECDPAPTDLAITVESGDGVEVDVHGDWFEVTGTAPGKTTLLVDGGADVTTSFEVTTARVGATRIFLPRIREDGYQYEYEPASTAAAFTDSWIWFDQQSVAPDGTPLVGLAEVELSPGTTDAVFYGTSTGTGSVPGEMQLSAAFGTLPIRVVDPSAIATLQINEEPGDHLNIVVGTADSELDLFAFDADGRLIAGAGPEPTVIIGDPALLELPEDTGYPPPPAPVNMRRVFVHALDVGTTTLEVRWGPIVKVYSVSITSFGE